ncbi:MAG: ribonuclease E/G [Lachnospiraceae bacterium]|nr:ribonuclease E/G [Candidatus Colinaster scatohippi]
MNNSVVVITYYNNCILCLYQVDGKAEKLMLYPDTDLHLKNVYVGKVKNIVKNIGAAFVEVTPGQICYLNLEECKDLMVLNRKREQADLKQGDEIPVQIIKGAVKNKNAVCTGILRLPAAEKKAVLEKAKTRKCFSVLYNGKPEYLTFFDNIDLLNVDRITCADLKLYEEVDAYLDNIACSNKVASEGARRLRENTVEYSDDYPLNKLYKIDSLIDELTGKTVWLNSGANIVIEYTEAMTIIDVNSAKSIRIKEDNHILNVNLEAAREAFRQIKLRNLSGMILIDFINDTDDNINALTEEVIALTEADNDRFKFIDVTGLGIFEFVRSKKMRPLHEIIRDSNQKSS